MALAYMGNPFSQRGNRAHRLSEMARVTGLEPAASGVTGRRSNQLSYTRIQPVQKGAGEARGVT